VLDDERHRARPFAADEETLEDAQEHEQGGGGEADRSIGRQEADESGDDADADDRDEQDLAPTDLVAHAAEDQTADGTSGQPDSEGGEGGHGGGRGVLAGEVLDVEDQGGRCREEEEVVPLEGGADQGAG